MLNDSWLLEAAKAFAIKVCSPLGKYKKREDLLEEVVHAVTQGITVSNTVRKKVDEWLAFKEAYGINPSLRSSNHDERSLANKVKELKARCRGTRPTGKLTQADIEYVELRLH